MLDSHPLGLPRSPWSARHDVFCDYVSILPRNAEFVKERLKKEAGFAREDTISKIKKKPHEAFSFWAERLKKVPFFAKNTRNLPDNRLSGIFLLFSHFF